MKLALLLIAPIVMAAQTGVTGSAAPQNSPAAPIPPEDLCTMEGKILNIATSEPVKRAQIQLQRLDAAPATGLPSLLGTESDESGHFAMKDIEPGLYRMTVAHNGFIQQQYGARSPGHGGTPITLTRAQQLRNLEIKLTPHGVLTGRVVDDEGEPVRRAEVQVMMVRYTPRGKELQRVGGATTNDLGEYRAYGLTPGKYYVSATIPPDNGGPAATPAESSDESLVTTYHPNTTDAAGAAVVEVIAGRELHGIDIRMLKGRTFHVKGAVSSTLPGHHYFQLYLLPRSSSFSSGSMRNKAPDAKGDFDFAGVAPGAYNLHAILSEGSDHFEGRIPIDVTNANVEKVALAVAPGPTVTGHISLEGDTKIDLTPVQIWLSPRAPVMITFSQARGKLKDDNTFELTNVVPDLYNVNISNLPAGCYVKSIRAEAVDVQAAGLDISNGNISPVEIVISPNAAQVSGTVQDDRTGQPFPNALIVLVPQDSVAQGRTDVYRQASSDQAGSFQVKSVPPGSYKVYAFEDLEPFAYYDPAFLKQYSGEPVDLKENDQAKLQLKVIH